MPDILTSIRGNEVGLSAGDRALIVRSGIIRSRAGTPISFPDGIDPGATGKIFTIPGRYAGQDISSLWTDTLGQATEVNGIVVLPFGEFTVSPEVIGAPGSYNVPAVIGQRFMGDYRDAGNYGSVLKLKDGSDDTLFTVSEGDAAGIGPGPFQMENILVDMNRSNQSGTTYMVNFTGHTASSDKQRAGFFRRVYVKNSRSSAFRAGTLRNAAVLTEVTCLDIGTGGAGSGLQLGTCSDWWVTNCNFGVTSGPGVQDSGADAIFFVNCNFFSAGTHGYKGDTGAGDHYFVNCSFDRNQRDGVNIGTTDDRAWVFANCRYNLNSQAANNTYSDVTVGADNTQVALMNAVHKAATSGNLPKYLYNITSGGRIKSMMPSIDAGAYATAITNDAAALFGIVGDKPTVTGATGGNAALQNLITTLETMGLIIDGTS